MLNINPNTYIISDTHFGHKNIIKYCDRPEDHNDVMFDKWLQTISIDDTVLHLGDLAFKKNYNLNVLPGNKYLIKGNHDHYSTEWYQEMGFEIAPRRVFYKQGPRTILFTHYPEDNFHLDWDVNIHGHIHNNGYVTQVDKGRLFINVSVEVMDYTPTKLRDILKEV
jgi:calcineurin-like phosphoesterase family protein